MANGNGEILRAWWPMIVVAAAGLLSYGTMQNQISALAQDVDKIEKNEQESTRTSVTERLKVKELETKQQAILNDVKEIKETQKEQGKKLDRILEKLNEQE